MRAFLLVALVLLAVPVVLAPAGRASLCQPASDRAVTEVDTPAMTLYLRTAPFAIRPPTLSVPMVREVWREENGIPGLQPNSDYACGGAPDFLWVDNEL